MKRRDALKSITALTAIQLFPLWADFNPVEKIDLRKLFRKIWLYQLFEFAHLNAQRSFWLAYPDLNCYASAIIVYFNDLELDYGYNDPIQNQIISQTEYNIISEFHDQLNKYAKIQDKNRMRESQILFDPGWVNLTSIGKTSWDKLKAIISDKEEIEYMTELEKL